MMTPEQFDGYLTKAQDRAFIDARDKAETYYTDYTVEGDASEADARRITGTRNLGLAGFTNVGGQFHKTEYTPGRERVTKFKKFTIGVITPEELEKDMLNNGRVKKDQIGFFKRMNEDIIETFDWTFEVITLDFLLRGDSTVATNTWPGAAPDGLALFSTSHVTSAGMPKTWSNFPTAATLNALTLKEAITLLNKIPDERGRPQSSPKEIIIMAGRYYEWRIEEILKTAGQVDTANNNVNSLLKKGIKYTVIINPYLEDSKRWAVINGSKNELRRFMKEKPSLSKAQIDPHTGNKIRRAMARYAIDMDSSKTIVGNLGL